MRLKLNEFWRKYYQTMDVKSKFFKYIIYFLNDIFLQQKYPAQILSKKIYALSAWRERRFFYDDVRFTAPFKVRRNDNWSIGRTADNSSFHDLSALVVIGSPALIYYASTRHVIAFVHRGNRHGRPARTLYREAIATRVPHTLAFF